MVPTQNEMAMSNYYSHTQGEQWAYINGMRVGLI